MKVNPLDSFPPLEARWLKGADGESDFLNCPNCGFNVAIVYEDLTEIYENGQKAPTLKMARRASLSEGAVKTKEGIYKFPPSKKRLLPAVPISLDSSRLPAIADCPNPRCKRQLVIRLHQMKK